MTRLYPRRRAASLVDFYKCTCNNGAMPTLKELRKAAKLSGEAVALRVGVTKTTYYAWEWGHVMPGGANLVKLESVLPGSISALVNVNTEAKSA